MRPGLSFSKDAIKQGRSEHQVWLVCRKRRWGGAEPTPAPSWGCQTGPCFPIFLPHLEDGTLRICSWPPQEEQAPQAHSWLRLPPEPAPDLRTLQPHGGCLAPWRGPKAMATPAWHAAVLVQANGPGSGFPRCDCSFPASEPQQQPVSPSLSLRPGPWWAEGPAPSPAGG